MTDTVAGEASKQDPAEVAQAAIQALEAHDDHVVTGIKNKVEAATAKMMPDATKASLCQTDKAHDENGR